MAKPQQCFHSPFPVNGFYAETVKVSLNHTLLISYIKSSLHSRPYRTELSELNLSLMLRPMVSRPVCLGIKQPSGAYDQIFITVRQLRVCWYGALSLTRGQVCRLQLLLTLASTFILRSDPAGLVTVFYCLKLDSPNLEGQVLVFISSRNRVAHYRHVYRTVA
jgi:hypothetical protein